MKALSSLPAETLINLERYPLDSEDTTYQSVVADVREQLARDGCAVLREFLTTEGITSVAAEADAVSDRGHQSNNRTNPYFSRDDPSLPAPYRSAAPVLRSFKQLYISR